MYTVLTVDGFWITCIVHSVLILFPVKTSYDAHRVTIYNCESEFGIFYPLKSHGVNYIRGNSGEVNYFLNRAAMHLNYYTKIAVYSRRVVAFVFFYSQNFTVRLNSL